MPDATSNRRDSVRHTLIVAVSLSLVCSVLVATTAVLLKPLQLENQAQFRQQVIEDVAGLRQDSRDDGEPAQIVARMVELESGRMVDQPDPAAFDPVAAAADPDSSTTVPKQYDVAGIRRRSNFAPVYLVQRGERLEQIILPVYGAGLWSTLRGYLALGADGDTILGLKFYDHAETPGLGDQIDNAAWLAQWRGKKLFGADGAPRVEVIRGLAPDSGPQADYQVDGLSGATLTGRGVTYLLHYWTGPHGFGPFLKNQSDLKGQGDE